MKEQKPSRQVRRAGERAAIRKALGRKDRRTLAHMKPAKRRALRLAVLKELGLVSD